MASLEDYQWLVSELSVSWLDRAMADERSTLQIVQSLRKDLSADRAHLVLEQCELRRRARAKFANPQRMFFTKRSLEQATDGWTAGYKAKRFIGSSTADFCCGIGGDLQAMAVGGSVVGIDRDPIMVLLATANLGDSPSSVVRQSEVVAADASECAAWHIDPDRRPHGGRTTQLELYEPGPALIDQLLAANPHGVVKLAPAATVPEHWQAQCESEWISRAGECKQLVTWFGRLAKSPGKCVATILNARGAKLQSIEGKAELPVPIADRVGRYLFEPDAAVLAARLNGELASSRGLHAITRGIAYLTGDQLLNDPAMEAFEVTDVLSFQTTKLKTLLRDRAVGRLEVKKRGVDVDPAKLVRELRAVGDNQATLFVTRVAGAMTAILTRRSRS